MGYMEAHAELVTPFEQYCRDGCDFEDDDEDWNEREQKQCKKKKPKKKNKKDKAFLQQYGEFRYNPEGIYENF